MKRLWILSLSLFSCAALASTQSFYCPQNQGFIHPGMTEAQVIAACGQPTTKQSGSSMQQRVQVKQLYYAKLNQGNFYPTLDPIMEQWSIPSGSAGTVFEVDIMNGHVSAMRLNGASTQAMTMCQTPRVEAGVDTHTGGGPSIQIGSPENLVYRACGNPDKINNTFVMQTIPSSQNPQIWIYQINQFSSPISLTFVNGNLQSIN